MCELLGMSANVPTDIVFSFTGLMQRGGRTGPHKDGWGVAFYEGRGVRLFQDPAPGCDSPSSVSGRSRPSSSSRPIASGMCIGAFTGCPGVAGVDWVSVSS